MDQNRLRVRLSKIKNGSWIAVIPLSVAYGDDLNAVGFPCNVFQSTGIELTEPFKAILEKFDGENLLIRTDDYDCLKVNVGDLKEVMELVSDVRKDTQT